MSKLNRDTTHLCDANDYVQLLTAVAEAQCRRLRIPASDAEDKTQEVVLHFLQDDLRLRFRTDANAKFASYVTTCIYRHLFRGFKVPAHKVFDAAKYLKMRKDDDEVSEALVLVDKIRTLYGARIVDSLLEAAQHRVHPELATYNPQRRKRVLLAMIETIKVTYETKTGSE